jgi:hypothetical protein
MNTRPTRRPGPGTGVAGRTIVVVVIAALLGWLILHNGFKGSDATGIVTNPGTKATTIPKGGTTSTSSTVPAVTTTVKPDFTGVKVVVLNGSGIPGAANALAQALQRQQLGPTYAAKNASGENFQTSAVYYAVGFDRQAAVVANAIKAGLLPAGTVPTPSPAKTPTDLTGIQVVILIGKDLGPDIVAGKVPVTVAGATTATLGPTTIPGGTAAPTIKPTTTLAKATTTTVKKTTTTKKA